MPKIPAQMTRTVMPSVGSGGNARSIAGGGGGMAIAGQALASGAANLAAAFQRADRERERVEAHYRSIEARTGARTLALEAETEMAQARQDAEEQMKSVAGTNKNPDTWSLSYEGESGEKEFVNARDFGQKRMTEIYQKYLDKGMAMYGAEAQMHLAEQLAPKAYENVSSFNNARLKLRHDAQMADFSSVAEKLSDQAADPTNMTRENLKVELQDHIRAGVRAGLIAPNDGVKMQEAYKDKIANAWATQVATRDPVRFLKMVEGAQDAGIKAGTGEFAPGKLTKLPEDIRPEKLKSYMDMAFASLKHQQDEVDRKTKAMEQQTKDIHEQTYRGDMARVLSGEIVSGELPQQLDGNTISADQANTIRSVEHALKVQKQDDPELKRQSGLSLIDYTRAVTKAQYGEGSLEEIESNAIEDAKQGRMLPGDVQTIMNKVHEAKGYQVSQEKQERDKAVQHAIKLVRDTLTTTGPMDKYDMVSENAKTAAEQDFWDTLGANPGMNPKELRDKIITRYEPIVAERKKVSDEDQVKLDDAKMQKLVQQGGMSKAAYKEWKDRSDTWRKIYKHALEAQKHPLPEPNLLDRAKEFGSSLFQGDE